jgi:pyridinium-3,5-bisthiocarboxylic acid mononucleotide nickel chelatase
VLASIFMKTLYFDCFSGIAGDMTIAAMLDLGLEVEYLREELKKLPVEGYDIRASRVVRANISAMKFDVLMAGQAHDHGHHHHHDHHAPQHFHRKASEILTMIRDSSLNANVKRIASGIFTKLAISEGRVHHVPPEDVEFHEVGAVDSIVDTVGTAIGFDAFAIERFLCSAINVGAGFIHCQHGVYPVPTPATADLLRDATIYSKHATTELVTPTGAAILAATVNAFSGLDGFAVQKIGYGAGTKQFDSFPNCLRLMLGEERPVGKSTTAIVVLEANIDDMTPQNFAYATERLIEAGALDVFTVPVLMKKGRPGHLLQILAPANRAEDLSRIVFAETTTIGIRSHAAERTVLERSMVAVSTEFGEIPIKVSRLDGKIVTCAPEYEDCARIARERGVPLKMVQNAAIRGFTGDEE